MLKSLFAIVLIITICVSCENENISYQRQEIYFEHYAINLAWGLSYSHWIIDDEGNVRVNKIQDSIIWINPENMNDYVERFDSVILQVDNDQLDYYIELISSATAGKIIEEPQERRDFGATVFNCYSYDKSLDAYEIVLLSEMSDLIDKVNTDSSAIEIDQWLKELHKEIYSEL